MIALLAVDCQNVSHCGNDIRVINAVYTVLVTITLLYQGISETQEWISKICSSIEREECRSAHCNVAEECGGG